jgi:CIC family chloride channel protein
VGSGNAMGPEGPTIHISAALASVIGRKFGLAKRKIQAMVPIGAAAGLSAAFNTPMAAMFFVFEELIGEITSRSIFGILIAVVLSAIVERTIVGEHALFILGLPAFETSWWMLLCLPIAILCAMIGTFFVRRCFPCASRHARSAMRSSRCGCGPRWRGRSSGSRASSSCT